jgi:hypothetical protein
MLTFLVILLVIAFLPQILENGCALVVLGLFLLIALVILAVVAFAVCTALGITI